MGISNALKRIVFKVFILRAFEAISAYKCFEKDSPPVDPEDMFNDGHCTDLNGNKFIENSNTTSCCECI